MNFVKSMCDDCIHQSYCNSDGDDEECCFEEYLNCREPYMDDRF
jgi:hypothetical protein